MKSVVQEASTIGKAIEQGWKTAGEPRDFSIKVLEIPQHNFLGFTTRSAKVAIVFEENAPREGFQREKRDSRDRDSRDQRPPREPRRDNRERDSRDRDSSRDRDWRSRDSRESSPRPERPPRENTRSRDRRDSFRDRDQSRDQGREQNREQRDSTRETGREINHQPPRHFSQQTPITEPADFNENEQRTLVQQPPKSIVSEALAPQQSQTNKQLGQWDDELVASAQKWLTETLQFMDLRDVTFTVEPQNFHLRITLNKPLVDDETKEKHLFASLSTLMIASLKKEFRKALRGHKIVIVHE